ncbi:hypothetical protein K0T92_02460 [Paenibacillus oenotherae]|uniref:ERV/ALR sulfhydryl oxidase domain-containing protein n=1 Tax=Paenibacillus oenotherae TaxID=1435645 RepID=A0ABS7D1D8_9BACL|nr:hypothetical protein [Paenibacillus oenotherae]MBW7473606.1 hypothetical protein [Paenibacillus oenotherae]
MKIRKLILSVFAVFSIFSFSQSAFAYVGIADTFSTAIRLNPSPPSAGTTYAACIEYLDEDWFYTDAASFSFALKSPASLNYDVEVFFYSSGNLFNLGYLTDAGAGGTEGFYSYTLLPGERMYFRISGHTPIDYGTGFGKHYWLYLH